MIVLKLWGGAHWWDTEPLQEGREGSGGNVEGH